jgi:DNA-binding GntR family transcriptional regulator
MVQALDQRDPAAMRAVLLSHLNHKRDVVVAQLRNRSQSGAQA